MLSRLKNMPRYDIETYALVLVVYIWLFVFIPDIWFSNVPCRLYAIDRMTWTVLFLLITDFVYCYWNYGLILDFKRDFNFYASVAIIGSIVIFFVMLIWFW